MVGSVIGIAGPLIGGAISSSASSDAAQTQVDAAREANQLQRDIYNQNRQDFTPWRSVGGSAINRLGYLMGLNQTGGAAGQNKIPGSPTVQPENGLSAQRQNQLMPYNIQRADGALFKINIPGQLPFTWDASSGRVWTNQKFSDGSYALASPEISASINSQLRTMINDLASMPKGSSTQVSLNQNLFPNAKVPSAASQQFQVFGQNGKSAPVSTNYSNSSINDPAFGSLAKSFSMKDFQADPGYGFRMSEGAKALERSAAARGGLLSGAQGKAITRFGQDTASNEFMNAYNRFNANQNNLFNRLSGLAGSGQQVNSDLAAGGQAYANNAGNIGMSAANASGAAKIAQSNSWSSGLQGAFNAFGKSINSPNINWNGPRLDSSQWYS